MNPSRPGCISDLLEARRLLLKTYSSLWSTSMALVREESSRLMNDRLSVSDDAALEASSSSAVIRADLIPWNELRYSPPPAVSSLNKRTQKSILTNNWRHGLLQFVCGSIPSHLRNSVFAETQHVVVVYDGFPKARVHLLLMLKDDLLPPATSVGALQAIHASQLRLLHDLGRQIAASECVQRRAEGWPLLLGYHAIPSLHPLHLHLISTDLYSPHTTVSPPLL